MMTRSYVKGTRASLKDEELVDLNFHHVDMPTQLANTED